MPKCGLQLQELRKSAPPRSVWRLVPLDFVETNGCTVRLIANGTEVTGTGDYGGIHVSGWTAVNATVVLEPPPSDGVLVWEVTCGNTCTDRLELFLHPDDDPRNRKGCLSVLRALGRIGPVRPRRD